MSKEKQMCQRCIMDTSDPNIIFNDIGICSHCLNFEETIVSSWHPEDEGKVLLKPVIDEIKKIGKNNEYDCVIGLSGGIDSSYLVYIAKEKLGLRPLAVHVDAGWNSEQAVKNIENVLKSLDIELFTYVVNWEEMKDLQRAYLLSGVANQDVPQDHVFFAKLYDFATKHNIRFVLTGSNHATESILPTSWGYNAIDSKNLKAIHKKFGCKKLKSYPMVSFYKYYFYYPFVKKMKIIKPLNYFSYNKDVAMKFLEENLGWQYYGGKHYESRFTKFFQSYYLPKRFGYDKRRAHLSSLIVSGQMSREEALQEIAKPPYDQAEIQEDIEYVRKKLNFNKEEFQKILDSPLRSYSGYANNAKLFGYVGKARDIFR